MAKIFVTSCETTPEGWRAQEMKLRELWELSDKKHSLTEEPDLADLILICDARFENYSIKIRLHLLLKLYHNKCFILSNLDKPNYFNRGIITSAEKSLLNFSRFRSCSYTAYYDPYHNPFIRNHTLTQPKPSKEYIISFWGRLSHPLRKAIFELKFIRKDIEIKDTTSLYDLWAGINSTDLQEAYYNTMLKSKFALCPRGFGVNSIRLFEAMKLGIAPIIVSDDLILPLGPKWADFCIFIKENDISNLESIVEKFENKYQEMGRLAKINFELYFDEKVYFNYVVDCVNDIKRSQKIPEVVFQKINIILIAGIKLFNFLKGHRSYTNVFKLLKFKAS
jgi:hypothetical protein